MLKASIFLCLCCFGLNSFCQNVVISEYYNETYPSDEWAEILVITDNTNLTNYTFRGNNGSQNNWGTAITFTSNSLWTNLRAGTIIVIWFRNVNSTNVAVPLDTNKSDGFIQVHCMLSTHFSYSGSQASVFGVAPYTSSKGNSFEVANGGELFQIRDSSGNNIHTLGHKATVTNSGNLFTSLISINKLNHSSAIVSFSNVSICPGNNISAYIGGTSDTLKTSEGSSYITQGLPNKRASDTTSNLEFWRSLRHPPFDTINLNTPIDSFAFGKVSLSWTTSGWTDPNPSDGTVGYIVLRNTTNSFVAPTDGKSYSTLDTVGTATVAGHVYLSTTLVFTDNYTFNCGTTYFYKIYAYRYSTNGALGTARGRAYNEKGSIFSSITKPYPIAQSINSN